MTSVGGGSLPGGLAKILPFERGDNQRLDILARRHGRLTCVYGAEFNRAHGADHVILRLFGRGWGVFFAGPGPVRGNRHISRAIHHARARGEKQAQARTNNCKKKCVGFFHLETPVRGPALHKLIKTPAFRKGCKTGTESRLASKR